MSVFKIKAMHAWSPTLKMNGKDDFHTTVRLRHKGPLIRFYLEIV